MWLSNIIIVIICGKYFGNSEDGTISIKGAIIGVIIASILYYFWGHIEVPEPDYY